MWAAKENGAMTNSKLKVASLGDLHVSEDRPPALRELLSTTTTRASMTTATVGTSGSGKMAADRFNQ